MKNPRHTVTDHAVLRYLERVYGVDVDGLRKRIGHKVDAALEQGASGAVSGGFVYRIADGQVVTVYEQNRPQVGQCGRKLRRGRDG